MSSLEHTVLLDRDLQIAKVLLVNDNATSRLTLRAVLQAGGYLVDTADSAAQAFECLDRSQYALVMTDLRHETPEASLEVVAHARLMEYQPAVALLTTHATKLPDTADGRAQRPTLVKPEDVPGLLTQVADMISQRAARLVQDELNIAG